ncbi:MAG: hypothetical protein GF308_04375 [Candidatus Heimdallarchaeota archaeon]|nr:hypothetical protein [Candidatus Heimdallarchaeota archaeon]
MSEESAILRCPICQEAVPQGYLLCPFCGADLTVSYEERVYAPVNLKEVWHRTKSLIIRPQEIFQEIADNPDIIGGLFFMVAIALGFSLQIIAILIHTRTLIWSTSPLVLLLLWIFILILPVICWFLGSWIIWIFARLLGGKATKKQIRAAVGYGLLPVAIGELFIALFYLVALPWRSPDPIYFQEIFEAMDSLRNSFVGITGMILHFLSLLVGSAYMVFIIKNASNFSWAESIAATGLPAGLFIIVLITYYFIS